MNPAGVGDTPNTYRHCPSHRAFGKQMTCHGILCLKTEYPMRVAASRSGRPNSRDTRPADINISQREPYRYEVGLLVPTGIFYRRYFFNDPVPDDFPIPARAQANCAKEFLAACGVCQPSWVTQAQDGVVREGARSL